MLNKIQIKIDRLKQYLGYLDDLSPNCKEKIVGDPVYRGALLHYLYMVADSSVVLAELVIKYQEFREPQSYQDAIDLLGEKKIIPEEFAYHFAPIAAFRNFLAHDYEKTDYEAICDQMLPKKEQVREYIKHIEKFLNM